MSPEFDSKIVELSVNTIKCLSIDAVQKAKSGHPGTPMGLANITFELFARTMRHDPSDPGWIARDRFVLSCGHASMLLYSMLHLAGYDLSLEELRQFRQWGSKTPGHPEHGLTAGVETTTGPLGQGIANAIGLAIGLKAKEARFAMPYAGARVFTICSDGDVMEGVSCEASSLAGHLGVDNLVAFYDDNKITIEGETSLAFSEDVGKRYEAYGWFVQHIDGHDHTAIRAALDRALAERGRPSFIVARTHIGHGAPNLHDTHKAHGEPLGEEEIRLTKAAMGFDPEQHFFVPPEVSAFFAARKTELRKARAAWQEAFEAWTQSNPELARSRAAFEARAVPADLYEQLLASLPTKEDATRNLSNAIQQKVAALVPSLVGGSADLAPSTKTLIKDGGAVGPRAFGGRNFHFGIREHGMGAICNGLALCGGIVPYGATFLIFSDYMRPSIRLSALMEQQCLWIFTHDSIFLGEDGPTHQPIEQLGALRLIHNLAVVRPADPLEVAAAWAIALARTHGPTAFALTRQKVPNLERHAAFTPRDALRGAYVVDESKGGAPDVVILATGSEVGVAVGARKKLEEKGRRVRVVSALCLEEFARQDAAYRDAVLPKGVRRASIEAGRTEPWRPWIGADGIAIGIDHYGASAPDKILGEKFGFTADAAAAAIDEALG